MLLLFLWLAFSLTVDANVPDASVCNPHQKRYPCKKANCVWWRDGGNPKCKPQGVNKDNDAATDACDGVPTKRECKRASCKWKGSRCVTWDGFCSSIESKKVCKKQKSDVCVWWGQHGSNKVKKGNREVRRRSGEGSGSGYSSSSGGGSSSGEGSSSAEGSGSGEGSTSGSGEDADTSFSPCRRRTCQQGCYSYTSENDCSAPPSAMGLGHLGQGPFCQWVDRKCVDNGLEMTILNNGGCPCSRESKCESLL